MNVTLDVEVATATKRILIIDDDAHIREVVRACLETLGGWDVLSAASAPEGLCKAKAERPDAILLDLMMPGMDGWTFLRKLRSEPRNREIPVVLLTAIAYSFERQQLRELGVLATIAKPFEPLSLTDQMARVLYWEAQMTQQSS
jgi:CheY-like chemotaxis protein